MAPRRRRASGGVGDRGSRSLLILPQQQPVKPLHLQQQLSPAAAGRGHEVRIVAGEEGKHLRPRHSH